jgi:hypothetical protein
MSSDNVVSAEALVITLGGVVVLGWLALRLLRRSRPGMAIGRPFAAGFALRILVVFGLSSTGFGSTIRGGDEIGFLGQAAQLSALPWTSSSWLPWHKAPAFGTGYLHLVVFAGQMKLLGSSADTMRITQVGIAMLGAMLIAAAAYDLSGGRAARLTAWLLALEPASLLFDEVLHKEPLLYLASGLMVFGATKLWRRLDARGLVYMLLSIGIALVTRHYVGYFMIACAVLLSLHAAIRRMSSDLRSLPLLYASVAIIIVGIPTVLTLTSHQTLSSQLQPSVNANATNTRGNGGSNGNNLALEQVDLSSRSAIIANLPTRISDVLLRPYPWQVGDLNQLVGAIGSVIAIAILLALIRFAWLARGRILERAGPFLYPFFFLLIPYALAVGNAGTGFRYRTHLVLLAIPAVVVLREAVIETRTAEAREETLIRAGVPRGRPGHGRELPAV